MTFPVVVAACDGQYDASLVGVPNVRVVGPTRSPAIDALKEELEHRVARGALLCLDVETIGVSSLAGSTRQTQRDARFVTRRTNSMMLSEGDDRVRHGCVDRGPAGRRHICGACGDSASRTGRAGDRE
jgi:hypothetical protein